MGIMQLSIAGPLAKSTRSILTELVLELTRFASVILDLYRKCRFSEWGLIKSENERGFFNNIVFHEKSRSCYVVRGLMEEALVYLV